MDDSMDTVTVRDEKRWQVLSGSGLKLIAVAAMLIDHVAYILLRGSNITLLSLGAHTLTLYTFMRKVGRISFPIYCFLLVEGFEHTRSFRKYAEKLLLFALISEIPWNLVHNGRFVYSGQNVFFTLFLGLLGLWVLKNLAHDRRKQAAALLGLLLVSLNLHADYGAAGFGFILMMYVLRDKPLPRAAIGSCFLSSTWAAGLAFIPISLYNGKRGFVDTGVEKYVFYVIYPVHMLILYLIRKATIGY